MKVYDLKVVSDADLKMQMDTLLMMVRVNKSNSRLSG